MSQKILASRRGDEGRDRLRIDQLLLARDAEMLLGTDLPARLGVDVAVAYPSRSLTAKLGRALEVGFVVAQPGAGTPSVVHLERFAGPSRLAVTNDPAFGSLGAAGLLCLPLPPEQLDAALETGTVELAEPASVSVQLSGRLRSFVCVVDAGLELLRLGLGRLVDEVRAYTGRDVVLEFCGAGLKVLSVPDRAALAELSLGSGAVGALFPSDEKTEVFLRDQKRSKAFRALAADAGAVYSESFRLDLGLVEPMVQAPSGEIRPIRELEGTRIERVLLGGSAATTLRGLASVAQLLDGKRVHAQTEFYLAPPSRQSLQVLAESSLLGALLGSGARLLEGDSRLWSAWLLGESANGTSLAVGTETRRAGCSPAFAASTESAAFAVVSGALGDPRAFRRAARVTLPRNLPGADALVLRPRRAAAHDED